MRVVHLDGYFDNPKGDFSIEDAVLAAAGVSVNAPRSGIWEQAAQAEVVLVRAAVIGSTEMRLLKKCRALIRYGIGLDKIDLPAATAMGIAVCNVPDFCLAEMADHTLMLALALARRLPEYQALSRQDNWSLSGQYPVRSLSEMRFVTLGFGRIARQVLARARVFGFGIAAADPLMADAVIVGEGVTPLSVEEAFQTADILSLHCPLTPETRRLVGKETLARMKPEALLVNTARGGLVDSGELAAALSSGRLRGAALDTTEPEPLPVNHPLHSLQNVIITPHMAWYGSQAEIRLKQKVAEETLRVLRGESPVHRVN